ncbi:MAG: transporter [Gemmatimonadetes bacterium]|nr:transporter [Gemmatimonadota bacterium]
MHSDKSRQDVAHFRYLGFITAANITFQLVSDATAGKLVSYGAWAGSVALVYFPFTYVFSDVLTEVYGYAVARRVLWMTLIASIAAGLIYQFAVWMPSAPGFDAGDAYQRVFGVVPRVLLGGWIAVFAGDISNNYTLAKMKVLTNGRHLWMRTIGSTIVGQGVNTALFYLIGLYGIIPNNLLLPGIVFGWIFKSCIEALMTPATYVVVRKLKEAEGVDFYDRGTDFNPFRLVE